MSQMRCWGEVEQSGEGLAGGVDHASEQGVPILFCDGGVHVTGGVEVREESRRAERVAARERPRGIEQQGVIAITSQRGQVEQVEGADVHCG